MNNKKETLLKFPCKFPIKIFAHKNNEAEKVILEIIMKHHPDFQHTDLTKKISSKNKYLSLTATINAKNKQHLDNLYRLLNKCEHVVMTL